MRIINLAHLATSSSTMLNPRVPTAARSHYDLKLHQTKERHVPIFSASPLYFEASRDDRGHTVTQRI